jgi:hypothetical protein
MATKKRTGDFAQTSVTNTAATTGTTVSATATVTVTSAAGLAVGMTVAGNGIPALTTILSIASLVLTLSANATASASGVALTFTGETQVLGLQDWSISWKRKTVDSTTTDDGDYEDSLESTKSWTVKAKYAYLMGDASQQAYTRAVLARGASGTMVWNFFPTDQIGDDALTGTCIMDGLEITGAGTGKLISQDVSLKGKGALVVTPQLAPVATTTTLAGFQAED